MSTETQQVPTNEERIASYINRNQKEFVATNPHRHQIQISKDGASVSLYCESVGYNGNFKVTFDTTLSQ